MQPEHAASWTANQAAACTVARNHGRRALYVGQMTKFWDA
jgi:hypothetical protein